MTTRAPIIRSPPTGPVTRTRSSTRAYTTAAYGSLAYESLDSTVYLAPSTSSSILARFSVLLDVVGVNPISSPEDTIDFYAGYSSVSYDPVLEDETNHGPFSWHAVVRVDPGLTGLWSFVLHNRPVPALDRLTSIYTKTVPAATEGKQLLVLDRIRQHLLRKFDSKDSSFGNIPMGLTFRDPNSRKVDIAHEDRLLGILPPKAVVEYHLDHFFSILYPLIPYLDETLFRGHMERLLGLTSKLAEGNNDRFVYINSTAAMDSAYLGLLCIVLRLSYLAFISNDPKATNDFQSSDLLRWPIGLEYVDYARTCLSRLQILNCSNLSVLQLMVFMRIYIELSPEEIEGPGRDMFQVNNGVLLQMAYAIGLNREPTKTVNALRDPRIHNVRRKLWVFIQFKDIVNSIKFGSPSISVPFSSDIRYPFLDSTNHNCNTPGNDDLALSYFIHLKGLMPLMRLALSKVLNVGTPSPIVELVATLNELEAYVHKNFPSLEPLLRIYGEDSVQSRVLVLVLTLYIPVQVFLISIYFRLFLHYEETEPSIALFYFKKLIAIMVLDYLPYIPALLKQPHPYFNHASQFVMNPHLEYFMHRLVGFLASWIIRLGYQITLDSEATTPTATPASIAKLKFLMRSLSRGAKSCLMGIHCISHRYCYAWRISTTFTYIERILLAKEYYRRTLGQTAHTVPRVKYTDDQVMDLITLLEPLSSSTDLLDFARHWHLVQDVIQLGKGSSEAVKIFNPSDSALVVEGAPNSLADLISGSFSNVDHELALDTPLLPVDAQAMHSAMGAFFEGPEFYFDAFNGYNSGVSSSGLFDGFGFNGI